MNSVHRRVTAESIVLAFLLSTFLHSAARGDEPGFKSLFNGKDLTGWQPQQDTNHDAVEHHCEGRKIPNPRPAITGGLFTWRPRNLTIRCRNRDNTTRADRVRMDETTRTKP